MIYLLYVSSKDCFERHRYKRDSGVALASLMSYLRKKLGSLVQTRMEPNNFVKANKLVTTKQMSLNKYRKDYSEIFLIVRASLFVPRIRDTIKRQLRDNLLTAATTLLLGVDR